MGGLHSALAADIRNINFRVVGTDEPTLIFVHGFACTLEDWDAQVRGLSPRFRCAALDLPGHGGSAMPLNGLHRNDGRGRQHSERPDW